MNDLKFNDLTVFMNVQNNVLESYYVKLTKKKKKKNTEEQSKKVYYFSPNHLASNVTIDDGWSSPFGSSLKLKLNDEFYKLQKGNSFKVLVARALNRFECYLVHLAKEGDIVLYDYPETALTLKQQRLIILNFVELIKKGVKVAISTTSDTILTELNILIMLNQFDLGNKIEIMKKAGYNEEHLLKKESVTAYSYDISEDKYNQATVDSLGIVMTEIGDDIYDQQSLSDEVYYSEEVQSEKFSDKSN